jgi:hypothetical protein
MMEAGRETGHPGQSVGHRSGRCRRRLNDRGARREACRFRAARCHAGHRGGWSESDPSGETDGLSCPCVRFCRSVTFIQVGGRSADRRSRSSADGRLVFFAWRCRPLTLLPAAIVDLRYSEVHRSTRTLLRPLQPIRSEAVSIRQGRPPSASVRCRQQPRSRSLSAS